MNKFLTQLPPVGQRIVRSVVAVALCFIIYFLRGQQGMPIYSALSVLLCIQPFYRDTLTNAKEHILGTFIGASWGLAMLLIVKKILPGALNGNLTFYLFIALFCGIVIYTTVLLRQKDITYFTTTVFLSTTLAYLSEADPLSFVANRAGDALIGIGVAILVNLAHLPREKNNDILFVMGLNDVLITKDEGISDFGKNEINHIINSGGQFTVYTHHTPAIIRERLKDIDFNLPVIAMDGALLYDIRENSYMLRSDMDIMKAELISSYLRDQGYNFLTNTLLDDLLITYYSRLTNDAERTMYDRLHASAFCNYVYSKEPVYENVISLTLTDKSVRAREIYNELKGLIIEKYYRIVLVEDWPIKNYSLINIYCSEVSSRHMMSNLKNILNIQKSITLGNVPGECDIYIENTDSDEAVKTLRRLYEPVSLIKKRRKHGKINNGK